MDEQNDSRPWSTYPVRPYREPILIVSPVFPSTRMPPCLPHPDWVPTVKWIRRKFVTEGGVVTRSELFQMLRLVRLTRATTEDMPLLMACFSVLDKHRTCLNDAYHIVKQFLVEGRHASLSTVRTLITFAELRVLKACDYRLDSWLSVLDIAYLEGASEEIMSRLVELCLDPTFLDADQRELYERVRAL